MATLRTTILLDEIVALKVKQMFGNLSRGINILLREHLFEEKKTSMFGVLKGRVSGKEIEKLREEDERAHR